MKRTAKNCLTTILLLLVTAIASQAAGLDETLGPQTHLPDTGTTSFMLFMSLAGLTLGVRR